MIFGRKFAETFAGALESRAELLLEQARVDQAHSVLAVVALTFRQLAIVIREVVDE